ncbi:response regulator receiver protein [Desulfarculus baarsii DSM 2075]|uniref:Response regulator receiver protein n=1 Tax=Desulfarculus baarsii (strain ATCC 33931 / DSM 2075 / LMG 7858 / VKM B-1802 / 2st14) TaxID=644282 RepID=E1QDA1_DESB2|nr:response regulator [Desulfarculus baarsii]ADK83420.1 response regulator receiver protein [Desulfarculus baarsii DSM 2075]
MSEARILIVDDEKEFLDTVSERLSNRGFSVDAAQNGVEALGKIDEVAYDAIVLDLMMPELDGLETLKRALQKKPDLQVILLSGQASLEKGVEAMKLGAMDFLEKPANLDVLAAKIKEGKSRRMVLVEKSREDAVSEILKRYSW